MASPRQSFETTARGRVVLALAAGSLLGAWLSGDANVRLAAGMLLAPVAVDFARKPRNLNGITVHVPPRRTVVGAPFRDELVLQLQRGQPVRDLLVAERRTRGQPAFVAKLGTGARTTTVLGCVSGERSHLLERVFELRTEWPLGLFRVSATAVVATDFVTEPRRVPLRRDVVRAAAERQPSPHTRSHLPGDDFHALREHQPSEDARGVHALRSAALGSLVRTVVRGRLPRQIGIVLDLRRPPGRPLHQGRNRFEWSLSACATLLDEFRAAAATVHVFTIGTRTVHTVVQEQPQLRDLLTLFAELTASPHRPLEPHALLDLNGLETCYWIPAGGYHAQSEHSGLTVRIEVLSEVAP